MQSIALFTLFLTISSALAAPSQQASEQVVAGEYQQQQQQPQQPHHHHHQQPFEHHQNQPIGPEHYFNQLPDNQHQLTPQVANHQHHDQLLVSGPSVQQQQPSVAASPVVSQPVSSQVEGPQPVVGSGVEQPAVHHVVLSAQPHSGQHQHIQSPPGYYSPAGLIQVVGETPVSGAKPAVGAVRSSEQYGQPESASLPANYKPFGSWGLYIGGNPADGYYTNYYKALTSSVDKQQQDAVAPAVKPAVSGVNPGPVLRQAVEQPSLSSSPYVGSDFYSFAYSPADLNSPSGVQLAQVAPAQSAQPVYGAATVYDSSYGSLSPYADSFATKKVGAAYAQQKEVVAQKEVPSKGYQSRVYVYPSPVVAPLAAPGVVQQVPASPAVQHQHAQVVAYPVPVGSQIVGSQSGVDGAFNPYGVHAFTRYAVKPTVVASQDQATTYYYSYPSHQQQVVRASAPAYKQQPAHQQQHVYSVHQAGAAPYYPLSYYGYPLSQLHYSHGSVVPAAHHQAEHQHAPVPAGHSGVELAASEKSETEDKQQAKPAQQKRA